MELVNTEGITGTRYEDMRVLVAGGSTGIGYATAVKLAELGVTRFVLMSHNEERINTACERLRKLAPEAQVAGLTFNAVDPVSVQNAVDQAAEILGGLDTLVCSISAPGYSPEIFHRTPLEDIVPIMVDQATPPMLVTRAVLPYFREQKGGAIVTVASDAAKAPTPGEAVFGAAMAAIVMFTRTVAIEAKRDGVRANVLTPSLLTGTATTERALSGGFSQKLFTKAAELAQLGVPSAEDQAELAAFLVGPAAAKLTGQAVSVNGGIGAL